MADQRIIERIQKLIAMAESPAIEEARTSAHMACKLILKHGLKVGAEQLSGSAQRPSRSYYRSHQPPWQSQDAMDELMRKAKEMAEREAAKRAEQAKNRRDAIKITAKYESNCIQCGTRINVGNSCIYWPALGRVTCWPKCSEHQ